MPNYQIIRDSNALNGFIDWLPDLAPNEVYYISLFARNKYLPVDSTVKLGDKESLKRLTATKDRIVDKIRQLEIKIGDYKSNGVGVPQESLALYITPNPRNLEQASKQLLIKLANVITAPYNGYNPQALALSAIQKACGNRVFKDFDFDNVSSSYVKNKIKELDIVNLDAATVLKTRGGVHVLINVKKVDQNHKNWYQKMSQIDGLDNISKAELVPVVGCIQGNFTPYFEGFDDVE